MDKERIKQMAIEAGGEPSRIGAEGIEFMDDELVRFAQAVARECAEITEGSSRDDDMPIHIRIFLNRASKAIRARFGLGE